MESVFQLGALEHRLRSHEKKAAGPTPISAATKGTLFLLTGARQSRCVDGSRCIDAAAVQDRIAEISEFFGGRDKGFSPESSSSGLPRQASKSGPAPTGP